MSFKIHFEKKKNKKAQVEILNSKVRMKVGIKKKTLVTMAKPEQQEVIEY